MNTSIHELLEDFFYNLLPDNLAYKVREASESIVLEDWKIYLYEIYNHIGYAKSYIRSVSETTYKKFKHTILLNLMRLIENEQKQ